MKNKKGLEFKSALHSLIVMSIMVIAIGIWVGDWNTRYNSGLTYDLGEYDKLENLSGYASSSKGDVAVRGFVDTGSGDFEGTSLRGSFSIINNIFEPFNVVLGKGGLIDSIENRWGIPNYITLGLVSMIVLAIIFSLIALFFRRPKTTV